MKLVEPLTRHRQADEPAAIRGHEIDGLGSDLLCRDRQIALVLPILVVNDDDHLAGANVFESRFYGVERLGTLALPNVV